MKLKRYGLGSAALCRMDSAAIKGPDIVEKPDGEYYKASEVDALLESIGAGGVDKPLFKKTIDEHRAEFEQFALSHGLSVTKTKGDVHMSHTVGWMWKAWKAARGVHDEQK